MKDTTESSLANVSDVDYVVARIFQFFQRRIDPGADTLIGRVITQLLQVDRFFLYERITKMDIEI